MKKRLITETEFYLLKAEHMGYVIATAQDYKAFVAWFDEQESKKQEQQCVKFQEKTTVGKAVSTPTTITYINFENDSSNGSDTADHESLILSLF